MQANWLGRSEGVEAGFPYAEDTRALLKGDGALKVFTTRADTLYGVTFRRDFRRASAGQRGGGRQRRARRVVEELPARLKPWRWTSRPREAPAWLPSGQHVSHPLTGEPVAIWVATTC